MDDILADPCCHTAWQTMQQAWQQHGNSAPFWDTYQHLLNQHCQTELEPENCANHIARMAQRLGAVSQAILV